MCIDPFQGPRRGARGTCFYCIFIKESHPNCRLFRPHKTCIHPVGKSYSYAKRQSTEPPGYYVDQNFAAA